MFRGTAAKPQADEQGGDGTEHDSNEERHGHFLELADLNAHEHGADHEVNGGAGQAAGRLAVEEVDEVELGHQLTGDHGEEHTPREDHADAEAVDALGHRAQPPHAEGIGEGVQSGHDCEVEGHAVNVGGVGRGAGAGGVVALVHEAAQEALGKLSAFDGNPALLDAVEGQRHAHKARDKEADGGEGILFGVHK